MKIKRDGLVCKLAYDWRPFCYIQPPERINLCQLMRRVVFSLFVMWPVFSIIWVLGIVLGSVFSFLFGYRMDFKLKNGCDDVFVPLGSLKRFKPIYFILGAWVCWSFYLAHKIGANKLIMEGNQVNAPTFLTLSRMTFIFSTIVICALPFALIGYLLYKWLRKAENKKAFHQPEFISVFKEYLKARKQKICPIVEIE